MTEAQSKVALLAGATGLVGRTLLDILLEAGDFSRVVAITRRPLAREHSRLANRTVQFDKYRRAVRRFHLSYRLLLPGNDHPRCRLGASLQNS